MDDDVTTAKAVDADRKGGRVDWSLKYWWPWIFASLASWAIWLAVVITDKNHDTNGFWPVWVTIPWGAVLLGNALRPRK